MNSIGIDLGTTNSVASHTVNGVPVVIRNRDDHPLTPSVIGFRRGEFLVGGEALRYSASAPLDTVYSTKRLIGLDFHDDRVLEVRRKVGYEIVAGRGDEQDVSACVRIAGRTHSPIEIATMVLNRIRDDCAKATGLPVEGATITVPAYFEDCQRNATREAGLKAGLNLRPLLNEPVAAALAFTLKERARGHRLLVYDLGGGTFDVSLVEIAGDLDTRPDEKSVQVLGIRGDMWLGGDDFDHLLSERIFRWIESKYGFDGRPDPALRRIVKMLAEKAKIELTERGEVAVSEPAVYQHPSHGAISVNLTIARSEFESDIAPLVTRSLRIVEDLLAEAGVPENKLTAVVLAGGSTRVPYVRDELKNRFGSTLVRHDLDPMHCVSLGAAIWNERFPVTAGGVVILDRLAQTGVPTAMPYGVEVYKDHNPRSFEVVVPAGTRYPTTEPFRKTFRPTADNQRTLVIPVFEGTSKLTTSNRCQGVVAVHDLPAGITKDSPINVEFRIDVHGTLTVDLDVPAVRFRTSTEIRRNQPHRSKREQEQMSVWKDHLRNMIARAKRFLEEYGEFVTPEDRQKIEQHCRDAQKALEENDPLRGAEIQSAVFVGIVETGTAGVLLLGSVAKEMADAKLAGRIGQMCDLLREKQREKDTAAIAELSEALSDVVGKVLGHRADRQSGPEAGQITTM
jgi:molecular chaperone DnaK